MCAVEDVHCDETLRRQSDIRRLYDGGSVYRSTDIVLVVAGNEAGHCRTLVVASRKVGAAVRRNRAKRLLREAHRSLRPLGDFGSSDVALIARRGAASATFGAILEQLKTLYTQAKLIRTSSPT